MSDGEVQASARWVKAAVLAEVSGAARTKVDRFELIRPLGRGAHGQVFLAHDPKLERQVALKLPRRRGNLERQLREARAGARVHHENVVSIYEVGVHEDEMWIAMEWIEGDTLRGWLRTSPSRAARKRVMLDVAKGLAALHRNGVVHRDIKPDNVMVDRFGRAIVMDLGVARTDFSDAIEVVGTRGYQAPEVESLRSVADERSDQYTFFVMFDEVVRPRRLSRLGFISRRGRRLDPSLRWSGFTAIVNELEVRTPWEFWVLSISTSLLVVGLALLASTARRGDDATLASASTTESPVEGFGAAERALLKGNIRAAYNQWRDAQLKLELKDPRLAAELSLGLARKIEALEPGRPAAAWVASGAGESFDHAKDWKFAAEARRYAAKLFRAAGDEDAAAQQDRCALVNDQGRPC